MIKKRYILLFFVILFGSIFFVVFNAPTYPTPVVSETQDTSFAPEPAVQKAQKNDLIIVDTPLPGEKVGDPLVITGRARGNWFFEGSFPITVTDWDGLIIGEGYASAKGEWMTTEYVPFVATVEYVLPSDTPYRRGTIMLHKNNASDDRSLDDTLEFGITF